MKDSRKGGFTSRRNRRSIRLKGYDYSQAGAYCVTIVTRDRACLFGQVVDGEMRLNELGGIAAWTWCDLPNHVPNVELDAFVVMPNHVHGIIAITDAPKRMNAVEMSPGSVVVMVGAGSEPAPTGTITKRYALPEIVRQFKTFSARRINERRGTPGLPVWQRNYYEHIIRNEESLNRIRQYIADNPLRWACDRENLAATKPEPEDAWRT